MPFAVPTPQRAWLSLLRRQVPPSYVHMDVFAVVMGAGVLCVAIVGAVVSGRCASIVCPSRHLDEVGTPPRMHPRPRRSPLTRCLLVQEGILRMTAPKPGSTRGGSRPHSRSSGRSTRSDPLAIPDDDSIQDVENVARPSPVRPSMPAHLQRTVVAAHWEAHHDDVVRIRSCWSLLPALFVGTHECRTMPLCVCVCVCVCASRAYLLHVCVCVCV